MELLANRGLEQVARRGEGGFLLTLTGGDTLVCERLMLATGGCRAAAAARLAVSLGHTLEPPVPSLFTFHIAAPWLHELAGISVESAEVALPGSGLRERGALLVTHAGLSGPAILRLSAWGARALHEVDYRFSLRVNWLPHLGRDAITANWTPAAPRNPPGSSSTRPFRHCPRGSGTDRAGLRRSRETRWAGLSRSARHHLIEQLIGTELPAVGRSLNQDEFVTCGGVRLGEVNFKTMESRLCPGLYFGGELLDIDGLTGGFNFQAAWTTGWIAGRAMAAQPS